VPKLAKQLTVYGVDDPELFVERINDLHHGLFPALTPDRLLCRPSDAHALCDAVRQSFGKEVPDDLVLSTMLNRRKRGK
jgi:hypothetical protein